MEGSGRWPRGRAEAPSPFAAPTGDRAAPQEPGALTALSGKPLLLKGLVTEGRCSYTKGSEGRGP